MKKKSSILLPFYEGVRLGRLSFWGQKDFELMKNLVRKKMKMADTRRAECMKANRKEMAAHYENYFWSLMELLTILDEMAKAENKVIKKDVNS